jgi:Cu2+-containing amine oxidase
MRFTLAALAALPIAFASMGAQAQMASYCEGRIVANAFYSNVQSNGSRSTAIYHVQLQNRSGDPIRYTVRFTAPGTQMAQTGSPVATLASYQQVTVTLGQQSFNNPSGTGQLSQQDMIRFTQVACPR